MRKIGIFGGTFNPIHNGHLHMLEILRDRLPLDEIWVMPANIPPHKEAKELASGKDRLKMATLAVEDLEDVAVCDLELRSPGKSYTYDTLLHLKKAFPEDSFTLIMGSDMFLSFEKWYRHQEILSMCGIVCAARHDGEYDALMKKAKTVSQRKHPCNFSAAPSPFLYRGPLPSAPGRRYFRPCALKGGGVYPKAEII